MDSSQSGGGRPLIEVLAMSCDLQAIRISVPYRPQQVIRIRRNSTNSKATLPQPGNTIPADQSDAGKSWSPSELDTNNANMDELVVVVGQLVVDEHGHVHDPTTDNPESSIQSKRKTSDNKTQPKDTPKHYSQFQPDKHADRIRDVDDCNTVTVVRIITRGQAGFYRLCSKQGLCEIIPLPATMLPFTYY